MNLTNNCLQASRSTKFCVFFNTKAQSAHTCVAVLTPDSLKVKYFMTCIPDLKKIKIKNLIKKKNPIFLIKKKIMIFFNPERLYNLATGVEVWSHYPMSPLHFIGVLVKRQQPISVIIETTLKNVLPDLTFQSDSCVNIIKVLS